MQDAERQNDLPMFRGTATSPQLSGEVTLTVDADGLLVDTVFDRTAIGYAGIESIRFANYAVEIFADNTTVRLSRMGQTAEWFYDALLNAFNRKVLECFKIEEKPQVEAAGRVLSGTFEAAAAVKVFRDCLCYLPADKMARRIPFVFVSGIETANHRLSLHLEDKELVTFSMLGRELEPLERTVGENIRALREQNARFIQQLTPALSFSKGQAVARVLQEGVAARLSDLPPEIAVTLERIISHGKMAGEFIELTRLADKSRMAVGIKRMPDTDYQNLRERLLSETEKTELTQAEEDAIRWIVWIIVSSPDGKKALAEFAMPHEDAATYLFNCNGSDATFLTHMNRALEASDLQRECFTLSDGDLLSDRLETTRMFVERTPVITVLRQLFAGRIIHRSAASWNEAVRSHLCR